MQTKQRQHEVEGGEQQQPQRPRSTTSFMSLSRRISSLSSFSSYSTTTSSSSSSSSSNVPSPSQCGDSSTTNSSLLVVQQNDDLLSQLDDDNYVRYMKKSDGDDNYNNKSDTAALLTTSSSSSFTRSSSETTAFNRPAAAAAVLTTILLPLYKTIQCQIQNTIYNFCDNGLPWKQKKDNTTVMMMMMQKNSNNIHIHDDDHQHQLSSCRSFWSGGTGILFSILPNIVLLRKLFFYHSGINESDSASSTTDSTVEIQLLVVCWLLQGILSVAADYVYIDVNHLMHGIDRIWSMFMYCYMVYQSYYIMSIHTLFVLNVIAGSAYILANSTKKIVEVVVVVTDVPPPPTTTTIATTNNQIRRWMYYHGIWHIVGSTVAMIVMYLVYDYCPSSAPAATATTAAVSTSYHRSYNFCSKAIY